MHGVTIFKENDSVRKAAKKHPFDGKPKSNPRVSNPAKSLFDQPAIDHFDLRDERKRYGSAGMLDVVRSLGFGLVLRGFFNNELASHPPRVIRCKRATDSSIEMVFD